MKINEDLIIGSTNKTLKQLNTEVENLKSYVLFSNDSGTNGSITLSDSSANYTYLEIYVKNLYNECYYYFKVYQPNGKVCKLNYLEISANHKNTAAEAYAASHAFSYPFKINGNRITLVSGQTSDQSEYSEGLIGFDGSYKEPNSRLSFIRVIGYK